MKTILIAFLGLITCVSHAQFGDRIEVGVVADSDNPTVRAILNAIEKETEALLGNKELDIDSENILFSQWKSERALQHLNNHMQNGDIELIIGVGAVSSDVLASNGPYEKPVIATIIINPKLQNLPLTPRNTSGVKNTNYIISPYSPERDLEVLFNMVPFKNLGILIDHNILEEFKHLDKFFQEIFPEKINATYEYIPVGDNIDEVIAKISQGYDAIYYTTLLSIEKSEQQRIIDAISEYQLPSFALFGRIAVEMGILAGMAPESNTNRLGRRVAVNVQRILDDIDPADIPVDLEYYERFTINMATARQIGYSPTWSILSEAELLNEEDETISGGIDIKRAIEEALASNWDLTIVNKSVEAGERNVSQARSNLLPQWNVGISTRIIDQDRAISSFGSEPERLTTSSTTLSQLLYSEQATAQVKIQKNQQQALEHSRDVTKLDVILEAAIAYLNLMRAKTFERIQKENLGLTRKNLELARVRQDVGYSGPPDLFRWESEIAFVKQDLNHAQAQHNNAEIDLNRILNRSLDQPFRTVEVDLNDPAFLVYDPRFAIYITSPGLIRKLTAFLINEGKRNLPELQQIDAGIRAQERLQLLNKRLFYTPEVGLQAGFVYLIDRGGAGTMGLDLSGLGGPSILLPNALWNIGLQASLPLFTGLRRSSQYQQATLSLERIRFERSNLELLLDQRIRSSMQNVGASFANIQLSRDAAEAAVKNFALVQDAYSKGLASVIQLIDAQNASINSQQLAANAGYEFVIDLLTVQRAVGEFKILSTQDERDAYFDRLAEYMNSH